jgi:putative ABC transport system substrate-binding protein
MKRREFLGALGVAAAAWPVAARAQASRPILGFIGSGGAGPFKQSLDAFIGALKEAGFVDGQNVTIEYRWAEGKFDRLPSFATELVKRPVDAILAAQGTVTALAAKRVTQTIPIVFVTADDPIAAGLVTSLARPGGNVTGISRLGTVLGAKNVELVHQVVPSASTIALLINPKRPTAEAQQRNAQDAAKTFGKTIRVLDGGTETAIEASFQTIVSERIGALIVPFDPVFNIHRKQILALAERHKIPAAYAHREFFIDGGLMSYGDSATETYALAGTYIGRILKGATPGDLPVQQASRLELALNLKVAKALGLQIPIPLLGRADEVIE